MAGYEKLDSNEFTSLLTRKLFGNNDEFTLTVKSEEFNKFTHNSDLPNDIKFYWDSANKLIIFSQPLEANRSLLKDLVRFLTKKGYSNYHLLIGLVGQGLTERHIITAYCAPDKPFSYFDSKQSNPDVFFGETINTASERFISTLTNLANNSNAEDTSGLISLGTQSFLDGVSCGHQTVGVIAACKKLIEQGEPVNTETILTKLENPVGDAQTILAEKSPDKFRTSLRDFLRQAWLDTYMPLATPDEHKEAKFSKYFLKWPESNRNHQIIYFATLGFLLLPLVSLLKIPTEFALIIGAQTSNYLKNLLIAWTPVQSSLQYLRTGLLALTYIANMAFRGSYLAIRLITSPITSFKAGYAVHPVLGVASAITSLALYGVLAYFAAPAISIALVKGAPLIGAALKPIVTFLAVPATKFFGLLNIALSPATAALTTLIVSCASIYGLRNMISNGLEKLVNYFSPKPEVVKPEVVKPEGVESEFENIPNSNVLQAFKDTDLFESFVKLTESPATSQPETQVSAISIPTVPANTEDYADENEDHSVIEIQP